VVPPRKSSKSSSHPKITPGAALSLTLHRQSLVGKTDYSYHTPMDPYTVSTSYTCLGKQASGHAAVHNPMCPRVGMINFGDSWPRSYSRARLLPNYIRRPYICERPTPLLHVSPCTCRFVFNLQFPIPPFISFSLFLAQLPSPPAGYPPVDLRASFCLKCPSLSCLA